MTRKEEIQKSRNKISELGNRIEGCRQTINLATLERERLYKLIDKLEKEVAQGKK